MGERIWGVGKALDRRAQHWVAQSLPKASQGLGESEPKGARVLAPRLNPPHAQKTMQSGLKSPDGLLEKNPGDVGAEKNPRQSYRHHTGSRSSRLRGHLVNSSPICRD